MEILQIIVLALVQGASEFLPISSSAHLILIPKLTDWHDQGLIFDIALHLGTLVAVILYFRKYLCVLWQGFSKYIISGQNNDEAKIIWQIILATIPVGLAGLIFKDNIANELRSIAVIAYATLGFGILLGIAAWINKRKIKHLKISYFDAGVIGLFQVLALIPGTSRAGITITAALLLGLSQKLSAKFSFLLAIPVIILSAVLAIISLFSDAGHLDRTDISAIILGFSLAALAAYFTITLFMKMLAVIGMFPFVIYRILLGLVLLIFFV